MKGKRLEVVKLGCYILKYFWKMQKLQKIGEKTVVLSEKSVAPTQITWRSSGESIANHVPDNISQKRRVLSLREIWVNHNVIRAEN